MSGNVSTRYAFLINKKHKLFNQFCTFDFIEEMYKNDSIKFVFYI